MKMQKEELSQKLTKLKSVVPKMPSIPALKGVLFKNNYLIANNMEMAVKTKIEGTGSSEESFIIPERAFDLINNLPDGEIEIKTVKEGILTIKANKIRNEYSTLDPELFPESEVTERGNKFSIQADILLESIKRVAYAVSSQGNSTVMGAMCLQAEAGQLNFAGSDGHVIAWDKVDYNGEFELLIPKNTVDKIKAIGLSGEVQIKYNQSTAVFITDEIEVYTRIMGGTYIKYKGVFKELPLHTIVSRRGLLEAMTRAKMCTEERNPVKFVLERNHLNLNIKDKITDYHETIDLQEEILENLEIGFDAKLVLETLKAFDCDNIGISFGDSKTPMFIEAEDSDFKALVLPVLINQ